jgi:hypothetical protein
MTPRLGMVADDLKFGSLAEGAPPMAFARSYSNRHALAAYFAGLRAEWDMIHYTADEFVAQGDVVFVRGSTAWRHKKPARRSIRRRRISGASATARSWSSTSFTTRRECSLRRAAETVEVSCDRGDGLPTAPRTRLSRWA